MYFKIFMKGLQPERYYRLLFKHKNNYGTTIYDNDYYFKISEERRVGKERRTGRWQDKAKEK